MVKSEDDTEFEKPEIKCDLEVKKDVDFSIADIIAWGKKHYSYTPEKEEVKNGDSLKDQKKTLNKTLGLQFTARNGEGLENEIITDHDLNPMLGNKVVSESISQNQEATISSRQKNLQRRQARAKKRIIEAKINAGLKGDRNGENEFSNTAKKQKIEELGLYNANVTSMDDTTDDSECSWGTSWPFTDFTDCLFNDLRHAKWEIRHGAATAIREVIIHHGCGGGRNCQFGPNLRQNDLNNALWMKETAKLLLCVVANDRFGDFLSDQVVAPVRETSAMALGSVIKILSPEACYSVINILLALLDQSEWQARHGSVLAMKYFLMARPPSESETNRKFLNELFSGLVKGLNDPVDDVVATAAVALIPVIDDLRQIQLSNSSKKSQGLDIIVEWLWNSIEDIDELSSSTQAILKLLSTILKNNFDEKKLDIQGKLFLIDIQNVSILVTRILPFLYHSSTTVRHSALETLSTLTSQDKLAIHFLHSTSGPILKHLFQQALMENNTKNLTILESLWNSVCDKTPLEPLLQSSCPLYGSWLNIITQPSTKQLPDHFFVYATKEPKYIGGSEAQYETDIDEKDRLITRAGCLGVRLLGKLACYIVKPVPGMDYSNDSLSPVEMLVEKIILPTLNIGKSAYKQFIVSLVISEWAKCYKQSQNETELEVPESLKNALIRFLGERMNYDETLNLQMMLQNEAIDLLKSMRSLNNIELDIVKNSNIVDEENLTQDQIRDLATYDTNLLSNGPMKDRIVEKQNRIQCDLKELQENYLRLNTIALSSIAGAIIDLDGVGDKLNPIIKPIMESVKTQQNIQVQNCSIQKVPNLLQLCFKRGLAHVAEKVVKNLTHFASIDLNQNGDDRDGQLASESESNSECSILSIKELKFDTSSRVKKATKSRKGTNMKSKEVDVTRKRLLVQKRGAVQSLKAVVKHFGCDFSKCFPMFWEVAIDSYKKEKSLSEVELITSLQTLEIVIPELAESFQATLKELLPNLSKLSMHVSSKIRHLVAKCFANLTHPSVGISSSVMLTLHDRILPLLDNIENVHYRQGAIEVIYMLTTTLGLDIIPFIVILIVPVLGRMSDLNEDVRFMASRTFAILVKLIPLESVKKEDNFSLDPILMEKKLANRKFVDELLDPMKCIEEFKIPVNVDAELRNYQMDGIKWLAFLEKYNLHGILCDDMGLGKTLQTLAVLVSSHFNTKSARNVSPSSSTAPLPSLVICPSTVCGHWREEIRKFIPERQHLDCIIYGQKSHLTNRNGAGNRDVQKEHITNLVLKEKVENLVVISSYDIVRSDCEFFASLHWNYLVLDEGHIIKNSKSKTTRAIKSLQSSHRLILSGTPIQNSVLDLWSLFDFLMPGFLGSEQQFNNNYSKPIISSRHSKEKGAQERGALAIESLHRQVLPFVMRRMKEDVLKDLPPKIIQDHYCDLSPLQQQLYEECIKKEKKKDSSLLCTPIPSEDKPKVELPCDKTPNDSDQTHHVFQTLQYLRKVCNHPKLVLDQNQCQLIAENPSFKDLDLTNICHSGKLPVLKELLFQCGIGISNSEEQGDDVASNFNEDNRSVVGQHRALIFFQLKSMIDIVENDLLKKQMPSVTYLRLDGSVPASNRHCIVQRFNQDVTIDVLLLTTSVGGLGLNLTGADTVIFVEQDWNPMKDLQAMDRAHRIGQKKVVNVYRLISKGTIEEKILGIQQFKLKTANTVISADNSCMTSMMNSSDQILDLFSFEEDSSDKQSIESLTKANKGGIKAIMDTLPELWDVKEYEDEYNVTSFEDITNRA